MFFGIYEFGIDEIIDLGLLASKFVVCSSFSWKHSLNRIWNANCVNKVRSKESYNSESSVYGFEKLNSCVCFCVSKNVRIRVFSIPCSRKSP